MKIFLAMPYTGLCDNNNILKKKYKNFFEELLSKLKDIKCDYFLAHKREDWGKNYTSDIESTQIDYDTINDSDLICMVPGIPYSGGVHVELGWASANKKKIRMFLKNNSSYSPMVTGVKCLTDTKYYYYEDDFSQELINLIVKCVKEEMEQENV